MTTKTDTTPDLTVTEVAAELNISRHSVYRLIRDGALRTYSLGPQSTRIRRADLDEFKARGGVRA